MAKIDPVEQGINCQYSFTDLFIAAEGRPPTKIEYDQLALLPQGKRNEEVKRLARKAHWQIRDVRDEYDGQIYTAFWPAEIMLK